MRLAEGGSKSGVSDISLPTRRLPFKDAVTRAALRDLGIQSTLGTRRSRPGFKITTLYLNHYNSSESFWIALRCHFYRDDKNEARLAD
jgi:hypothetical protein